MRHVVLLTLVVLLILTFAQNWIIYSAALMLAAWFQHDGSLTARVF